MGPQDPKDVTRETARDLSARVGELAALKADATHWLTRPGLCCTAIPARSRERGGSGCASGGAAARAAEREAGRVNAPSL
jgi:hypothetical protein